MRSTDSRTVLFKENQSVDQECYIVGEPYQRLDATEKVTGIAKFGDDIKIPQMLYGRILRSCHAHAKILNIDTSEAEKLSGVKMVITNKDFPDIIYGMYQDDQRIFARDKVNYYGEAIAAVAAEDPDIAQLAIDLINVKYEKLPVVLNPEEAIRKGAYQIHKKYKGNIAAKRKIRKGDVNKAFQKADYIFENTYTTSMVDHVPIETHVAVAESDPSGFVTIWSPTQAPFNNRFLLSRILQIPMNKIRIIQTSIGGAFGGKQELMAEPAAVILAKKTKRPVKVICDRVEEFTASTVRHPFKMIYKTGVSKEGKILTRKIKLIQDCGAYNDLGEGVLRYATIMAAGPYCIDHVWIDGYLVYTNKNIGGVMRGVGVPQVCFAGECQLDLIARKLKIDPLDLRLKNALKNRDISPNGQKMIGIGYVETLEMIKDKIKNIKIKRKNPKDKNLVRGFGISSMMYSCSGAGRHDYNSAIVKFNEDGTAIVLTGTPDVGQGSRTILAQIAAEELGLNYEDVWTSMADTAYSPVDMYGANASRISYMAGNAVRNAARDVKEQIFEYLIQSDRVKQEEIVFKKGWVYLKGKKQIEIKELVKKIFRPDGKPLIGRGSHNTLSEHMNPIDGLNNTVDIFLFATGAAEVEVDLNTGTVKVIKIWAAHDVGKAINPLNIEGQIEGGIGQALGFALCEKVIHDSQGIVMNPSFLDYKIFTSLDMPEIIPLIVEVPEPKGPYGVRGVGESTTIPGAASIANAIFDATDIVVDTLPMTPEYIYHKLKIHEK